MLEKASPWLASHRLPLFRYFTAGICFVEAFAAAKVLSVAEFGAYSITIQMASLFALVGLAGGSGFIFHFYNSNSRVYYRSYVVALTCQIFLLLLALIGIFYLLGLNHYLPSVLFSFFLIPNLVLEPILRVHRLFYRATSFRLAISLVPALFLLYVMFFRPNLFVSSKGLLALTLCSWIAGSSGFLYIAIVGFRKANIRLQDPEILDLGRRFRFYYRHIFSKGVAAGLVTGFGLLFAYLDRIFIDNFYSAQDLGIYSLALQICTAVSLYFMTRNYVIGVEAGEIYKLESPNNGIVLFLKAKYRDLLRMGILLYVAMVGATWTLSHFFTHYDGLLTIVCFLGVGIIANSIGPMGTCFLHYSGRMKLLLSLYGVLGILGLLLNVVAVRAGWSIVTLVGATSVLLGAHAVFTYFFIQWIFSRD